MQHMFCLFLHAPDRVFFSVRFLCVPYRVFINAILRAPNRALNRATVTEHGKIIIRTIHIGSVGEDDVSRNCS